MFDFKNIRRSTFITLLLLAALGVAFGPMSPRMFMLSRQKQAEPAKSSEAANNGRLAAPTEGAAPRIIDASGDDRDRKWDWVWRTLRGIRSGLPVVFSWPVVVLALFVFLAKSRTAAGRLAMLFQPFRSIKVFGAELVFTPEAKISADEVLDNYKKQVKTEFDRRAEILRLWDKMEMVVDSLKNAELKDKEFRCTIHVPDVLFQDTLYQLLDYYPKGGGRGRRWSLRFGMIGLAWRSCADQVEGNVPTAPRELLRNWGMKKHEATAAGTGRPSFACVVLTDESSTPIGLFYLDSPAKNTFGTTPENNPVVIRIRDESRKTGLAKDLADLGKELRKWSPVIRLYDEV